MSAPASEPTQAPRALSRLYRQALLLVVLPLVAALAVLLVQNNRLIGDERQRQAAQLFEANRQAQFALEERVARTRQIATLLVASREVVQAMTERDNEVLHAWGHRVIAAGLASEIYFLAPDGQVIARGHEEFRFGDRYSDALISGRAADRMPFAGIVRLRGGTPAIAVRAEVVRFDVQWTGVMLLYRELAPRDLAGLGIPPDIHAELRAGAVAYDAGIEQEGTRATGSFDVVSHSAEQFHLELTRDAPGDTARLRSLNVTLWVMAAMTLLALPILTIYALYRLLAPIRLLYHRLRRFAAERSDSGELVRDIEALANTRNELGVIAASVAEALQKLQATQADLVQAQKLAGLGAMVAGVSHEMNTPLGNSLMAATTLRERARELAAEIAAGTLRRSALDRFFADCDEGTRILESNLARAAELLRSFKQVAMDQASDRRREYDVREVAADVLLTLRPTLKKLPVTVALDVPPGMRMDGFPGALAQVLTNLVQNAVQHGLQGTPKDEIRVSADDGLESVKLRVADNGRGIPRDIVGRIFEPFFTTRLGSGGNGLGLNICRKLVHEVLGGTISVQSEPGAGTTFLLELPKTAPHRDGGSALQAGAVARLATEPPRPVAPVTLAGALKQ